MSLTRYDRIGWDYARHRREDPEIAQRIRRALGDARTVVNVGAGAGSYEPRDLAVTAIEPSEVMARQRPREFAASVRATADALPLWNQSVDAAMAVLTIHHWAPDARRGVEEMRRVSRGAVAIVTIDATVSAKMWLMAEYLPELARLDLEIFPPIEEVCGWLGEGSRAEVLPVSRDTPDGMLLSFWAHPERVLDECARQATSGFARMPAPVVERAVREVRQDLESGAWDRRHRRLRQLPELDVGLRLLTLPGRRAQE